MLFRSQDLLDIDGAVSPDLLCNLLDMPKLYPGKLNHYDAVYCSHNLEHYYAHEVPKVLHIFMSALKDGGSVEISVPNVKDLMRAMLATNLDIGDVWYRVGDAPITFHDVLYGYGPEMAGGNIYYAHKCGFTGLSLWNALARAGFENVTVADEGMNLRGRGTKPCPQSP